MDKARLLLTIQRSDLEPMTEAQAAYVIEDIILMLESIGYKGLVLEVEPE